MIISFDEFVRTTDSYINIPDEDKTIIEEGGIETDGNNLGGSFYNKDNNTYWGYYSLKDYTQDYYHLETNEVVFARQLQYEKYSKYNWIPALKKRHIIKTDEEFEAFLGDKKITHEGLLKIKEALGCEGWFFDRVWQDYVEKAINRPDFNECVTVEHPYEFYICGNDDTSFTKWFNTKKELMEYFKELSNHPLSSTDYDQMVFTN